MGLLQNLTRQATAPIFFVFITHLKDASRLKGVICGNPGLQAGETGTKTSRLEDGTFVRHVLPVGVPWPRHRHDSQAPPFRRVPSSRRPGLVHPPPALKGGVTAKFAFQASYAFQASAVLLTQDTWEIPQKDFCLPKSFATAPFLLSETLSWYHLVPFIFGKTQVFPAFP